MGRVTARATEGAALKDRRVTWGKARKDNPPEGVSPDCTEPDGALNMEHFISSPPKWRGGLSVLHGSAPHVRVTESREILNVQDLDLQYVWAGSLCCGHSAVSSPKTPELRVVPWWKPANRCLSACVLCVYVGIYTFILGCVRYAGPFPLSPLLDATTLTQ